MVLGTEVTALIVDSEDWNLAPTWVQGIGTRNLQLNQTTTRQPWAKPKLPKTQTPGHLEAKANRPHRAAHRVGAW